MYLQSTLSELISVVAIEPRAAGVTKSKWTHNVWNILQRARIVEWMMTEVSGHSVKNIASKAVKEFPLLFRTSPNADLVRATRVWKSRYDFHDGGGGVQKVGNTSCIRRTTVNFVKRVRLKAKKVEVSSAQRGWSNSI